jgi:hypothetical protein
VLLEHSHGYSAVIFVKSIECCVLIVLSSLQANGAIKVLFAINYATIGARECSSPYQYHTELCLNDNYVITTKLKMKFFLY